MAEKSNFDQREEGWRADYRSQVAGLSSKKLTPLDDNHILARTIVNEDAEQYGPLDIDFNLSERSLHTMIHHTRQDAAHAVLNTSTLWYDVRTMKRMLALCLVLALVNFALMLKISGFIP